MPYVNNDDKSYASSGVGTAALTTGIIGTALGSGILNGGFSCPQQLDDSLDCIRGVKALLRVKELSGTPSK